MDDFLSRAKGLLGGLLGQQPMLSPVPEPPRCKSVQSLLAGGKKFIQNIQVLQIIYPQNLEM